MLTKQCLVPIPQPNICILFVHITFLCCFFLIYSWLLGREIFPQMIMLSQKQCILYEIASFIIWIVHCCVQCTYLYFISIALKLSFEDVTKILFLWFTATYFVNEWYKNCVVELPRSIWEQKTNWCFKLFKRKGLSYLLFARYALVKGCWKRNLFCLGWFVFFELR